MQSIPESHGCLPCKVTLADPLLEVHDLNDLHHYFRQSWLLHVLTENVPSLPPPHPDPASIYTVHIRRYLNFYSHFIRNSIQLFVSWWPAHVTHEGIEPNDTSNKISHCCKYFTVRFTVLSYQLHMFSAYNHGSFEERFGYLRHHTMNH